MADFNPGFNSTASVSSRRGSWWAKLIAIAAILNLVLVLFNLTYIPWRDLYLRQFPSIVAFVDPYKGIEPHRVTQQYLTTVDDLAQKLHQVNLQDPDAERLLEELRHQSVAMIEEDPFLVASKVGTFAKIKHRMRQHLRTESAKEAFNKFWSSEYLAATGVDEALTFFDSQIRPSVQKNYFRNIDDNGNFVDEFWRIDIFFTGFFGLELLISTLLISSRNGINWFDALVRRWYDVLLLIPFWRWLRVIPVTVRLHQSRLVNLDRVLDDVTHEPVAYLADRVSKFIIVRFIDHAQDAISQGNVARFLFAPRKYITVNEIDEPKAIADRLLQLLVYKVLPQVQPDVEALLHHSIEATFKQSNFYQGFQKLPAIGNMPVEITEQLAHNLAQGAVKVLTSSYSDKKGREIVDRFTQKFNAALREEIQDDRTISELQSLFSDWLEELKLNYVQHATAFDPKATLAEVDRLHQEGKPSEAQPF
jgi:hypothetical protein